MFNFQAIHLIFKKIHLVDFSYEIFWMSEIISQVSWEQRLFHCYIFYLLARLSDPSGLGEHHRSSPGQRQMPWGGQDNCSPSSPLTKTWVLLHPDKKVNSLLPNSSCAGRQPRLSRSKVFLQVQNLKTLWSQLVGNDLEAARCRQPRCWLPTARRDWVSAGGLLWRCTDGQRTPNRRLAGVSSVRGVRTASVVMQDRLGAATRQVFLPL